MAKITKPLTNTEVKQAKPKDKIYALSDGGGLQLRVKPNGSKLWLFGYYTRYTKKRTSLSFGSYPSLSLADARIKREESKELLAKDIDLKEYRDEQKRLKEIEHNNTLEFIAAKWLEIKKLKISEDHANDTWRSLELHIFPKLGKYPLNKITAVKAIEVIEPIAAKGSLETVKRLCQRLNEVMIYSVNTGIIEHNPLAGISKAFKTPVKQHLPTLKPEQLPTLMMALATASIKITTNEQGFDPDVIEAALAHVGENEVRNAYNRAEYIERRKPVMAWWSEYVDKAATGNMSLAGKKALKLVNG